MRRSGQQTDLTIEITEIQLVITNNAHQTTLALEPRTLVNGTLCKPTEIVTKLANYLKNTPLKYPTATIIIPINACSQQAMLPFSVLQFALVLSKAGLSITQIQTTHSRKNLLSLLQNPHYTSPKLWLISSMCALSILSCSLILKHHDVATAHAVLTTQKNRYELLNKKLEQQHNDMLKNQKQVSLLEKKVSAAQNLLRTTCNPKSLLTMLAQQIPKNVWLTQISIEPKQQASPIISIKGTGFAMKTISLFLKNVTRCDTIISNSHLVHVSKEKRQKKKEVTPLYHFIIEGNLEKNQTIAL